MSYILQQSIIPFLKRYWWTWLSLLVVTITIMIIGPSVVGNFIYNVFRFIFQASAVGITLISLYQLTIGRKVIGIWGGFRIVGVLGVITSAGLVYSLLSEVSFTEIMWKPEHANYKSGLILFTCLGLFFFLLLGLGELLLYLHKINFKIKQHVTLPLKKEMVCPRCVGKGFVDKNDIERLGMTNEWMSGVCTYCDAQGYVDRGKTKIEHPLIDYDNPSWKKWEAMTDEEVKKEYMDMKNQAASK